MRFQDPNRPSEKSWPAPPKKRDPKLELHSSRRSALRSYTEPDPYTEPPPSIRPQLVKGPRKFNRLNAPDEFDHPDAKVREMLKHNVRRDRIFGRRHYDYDAPSQATSTRGRDFWVGLLLGNSALGGLYLFLPQNVITFLFIVGGMAIYSVGFAWLMYSVSDDY